MAKDDRELITLVQQGDQQAFVSLMRKYKDPITNFVFRYLGNYEDATDVAQETFVRLFKYAHTYTGDVKFNTWLYTIAANLAKTELGKYWRKNGVSLSELTESEEGLVWESEDSSFLPDAGIDASEIEQQVQRALLRIAPVYREAVILRDIQQLSYEEIADVTKMEIGTVKSRINRGRARLQQLLEPLYQEMFG